MTRVVQIMLSISNAFLVKDEGCILVDTGNPGEEHRILQVLAMEQVALQDLRLILHTHGHSDHCGSSARLKEATRAPLAIHTLDAHMMAQGKNDPVRPINLAGWCIKPIIRMRFPPVQPDLALSGEIDLRPYGVRGNIIFTPGHTPGSLSLLTEAGDVVAGDLMMGGYVGGKLLPGRPGYHYFADDLDRLHDSIRKIIRLEPRTVYVGHGGPLKRDAIAERFRRLL
jgi:glyoxylase-like metal-dependent hydrolase (beta-lactamase superfamily II)